MYRKELGRGLMMMQSRRSSLALECERGGGRELEFNSS
jgi:hypothetical protein